MPIATDTDQSADQSAKDVLTDDAGGSAIPSRNSPAQAMDFMGGKVGSRITIICCAA